MEIRTVVKRLMPLALFLIITVTIVSASQSDAVPVYRFWNTQINSHFYTISLTERDHIIAEYPHIWVYEEIAFYVHPSQISNAVPVYRFWNKISGAHFYTIHEEERGKLLNEYAHVFEYEDIAFYVFASQQTSTVPVYRFWYNGSAEKNSHFYTISESERDKLINEYSHVYVPEGIAFYVFASAAQTNFTAISNLKVTDRTTSSIMWEWQNPPINFNGIAVYINGANRANLSATQTSYKAENLQQDKTYTITLRIINQDGSLGESVSDTARTLAESQGTTRTIVKHTKEETPVVFTSDIPSEVKPININTKPVEESAGAMNGFRTIHLILALLVILSLVVLILIFKNI
jgi:hypothetical protein